MRPTALPVYLPIRKVNRKQAITAFHPHKSNSDASFGIPIPNTTAKEQEAGKIVAMLSNVEQNLVEKYVRLSCTYCCYPFDWNPVQGQLEVTKSRVKYALASVHFGFTLVYTGFVVYRLVPGHGYDPHIIASFSHVAVYHIFFLAVCFFHVAFQFCAFRHADETVYFYNQIVNFNSKSGLQFCRGFLQSGSRLESAFILFDKWLTMLGILLAGAFLVMPDNPHYMYSMLPLEWKSCWSLLLFFAIEIFYAITAVTFYVYATLIAFLYLVSTNFWLRHACDKWLSNPESLSLPSTSSQDLEQQQQQQRSKLIHACILRTHRSLTILNTLYNQAFGSYAFPTFKTACEICIVVCLYGMIRTFNQLSFKLYLFLPGLGFCILAEHTLLIALMASVHETSSKLKKNHGKYVVNYGHCLDSALRMFQKKTVQSCRPLRCKMGDVYFIDRSIKIRLSGMICETILLLLISF